MQYTEEAIKNRKDKIKKIKMIVHTIFCIILIPLLTYNIFLLIKAVKNPKETPTIFGVKMYVILSGSMRPELDIGDIVIVKDCNEFKKGDIISFRKGQSIITHRIIDILNENNEIKYKTKGDNNNSEDKILIKQDDIEGIVINKISKIGNFVLIIKDKTILIMVVLFYYIFLVREQSVKKKKDNRKIKRQKYEKRKNEELTNEEKERA